MGVYITVIIILTAVFALFIDNFDTLNKGIMAETRKLCSLRSMIIANFTDINEQFRNHVQLADISLYILLITVLILAYVCRRATPVRICSFSMFSPFLGIIMTSVVKFAC